MLLDLVVALAAGAALLSIPAGAPRGGRTAACAVVLLGLLAVALLTAGVPAKFLEPAYWDDLVAGLGQGIASTPAVVNAVVDALRPWGIDDVEMPMTSQRVWKSVQGREFDPSVGARDSRDGDHEAAPGNGAPLWGAGESGGAQ